MWERKILQTVVEKKKGRKKEKINPDEKIKWRIKGAKKKVKNGKND